MELFLSIFAVLLLVFLTIGVISFCIALALSYFKSLNTITVFFVTYILFVVLGVVLILIK